MADWVDVKDNIAKADKAKTPPTQTTPAALYIKFKAHYSNKNKELFTDSNMGPRNQADHVQERTDERLEGIEEELTELAMVLKAVATRADRSVPGVIRAPPETERVAGMTLASDPQFMSMVESQRALSAQVQIMMQSMANNYTGNPQGGIATPSFRTERDHTGGWGGGGRGRGWLQAEDNLCRQYQQWCHSNVESTSATTVAIVGPPNQDTSTQPPSKILREETPRRTTGT
jgi:hypothetical protein